MNYDAMIPEVPNGLVPVTPGDELSTVIAVGPVRKTPLRVPLLR
jgi:hypothetical protein